MTKGSGHGARGSGQNGRTADPIPSFISLAKAVHEISGPARASRPERRVLF